MWNINEEVEGWEAGGEESDAEVDVLEQIFLLLVVVIHYYSISLCFISSPFSIFPTFHLVWVFLPPVISLRSPFTEWCDNIHFANSEMLYYIGG